MSVITFSGAETAEDDDFLASSSPGPDPAHQTSQHHTKAVHATALTADNFEDQTSSGKWFIKFYGVLRSFFFLIFFFLKNIFCHLPIDSATSQELFISNHYHAAPWCQHCQTLAPVWDDLAAILAAQDSLVNVATFDCTTAECTLIAPDMIKNHV